jgi:hypothetical protein
MNETKIKRDLLESLFITTLESFRVYCTTTRFVVCTCSPSYAITDACHILVVDACFTKRLFKNPVVNWRFPLLRFLSALHCGYSGITDIQDGLFLSWPVQELLKKARVRCAIANSKIFAKTFNIFIRGRYLYQWYHYNHNAKRYENVIRGIANLATATRCMHKASVYDDWYKKMA